MNISPIKNIRYVVRKYIYPRRKTPGTDALFLQPGGLSKENSLIREPSSDLFQRSSYSDLLAEIEYKSLKNYNANRFLNIFHINKTNYAKLSPAELKMLRAQLSPELVERAEVLVAASKIIKNIFDEKFGENKYTFVSIGRSLSTLANGLNFLGVETRQIPFSGCAGYDSSIRSNVDRMVFQTFGFNTFKNFLKKTLQPESGKHYVFCDYANTGNTLRTFQAFLKHRKVNLSKKMINLSELMKDLYCVIMIVLQWNF